MNRNITGEVYAGNEKAVVRRTVFNHLAGIVLAPTMKALWNRGIFGLFGPCGEWVSFNQIERHTRGNRGYLRVALRLLVAQGWLKQRVNDDCVTYALTQEGSAAVELAPSRYEEVTAFVPHALYLEDYLFGKSDRAVLPVLESLVSRAKDRWGIAPHNDPVVNKVAHQILVHLDGMVIGPAIVALARNGVLAQLEGGAINVERIPGNRASLNCVWDLLSAQGWITRNEKRVSLTRCGLHVSQLATSYGVTVSYLPLFYVLNSLLFGNARISRVDETGAELLVDRAMNVWGSGGAHKAYFKKIDEIVREIFCRPLEHQPKGICDMGCGDGTLLERLYRCIKTETLRGNVLEEHPLTIVGVDLSKVARRIAKRRLHDAGIPTFHVIDGDIGRPARLAGDLEALGLDIHDLLHVRSFLDHNRSYSTPINYAHGKRISRCSGAFVRFGEEVPSAELEENLVRHFRRWAPYVGRFGLLILELHTLPPETTAANLEKTPTIAYDATHGFSDQYLVELPIFLDCAREAGLNADPKHSYKFPSSELATVSMNVFVTMS